jgi:excisionase family DNA binding protein
MKNSKLLTIKEAAKIVNCSPETILYHINHKNFPAVMLLGQWVMNERDLELLNIKPRRKKDVHKS